MVSRYTLLSTSFEKTSMGNNYYKMVDLTSLYFDVPIVTRSYFSLCIVTTGLCALDMVSRYTLHFSVKLIFYEWQFWRLLTTFTYFGGSFGLEFFFHLFFLIQYSADLERTAYTGRSGAYAYLIIFAVVCLLVMAPQVNVPFLGESLVYVFVYVWGRLNKHVRLSFFGLVNFRAPQLVWMLMLLSYLLEKRFAHHLLGIVVGHLYYYLAFVYPSMTGVMLLKTPSWLLGDDESPDAVTLDNFH